MGYLFTFFALNKLLVKIEIVVHFLNLLKFNDYIRKEIVLFTFYE